jgi:hypothetical protein
MPSDALYPPLTTHELRRRPPTTLEALVALGGPIPA